VESMAASAAQVIASLPDVDGDRAVRVFGGGTRSTLLLDALARHTGGPVRVGPIEAAALGNALAQGLALEVFATVDDGRATLVARPQSVEEEEPGER